MKIIIKVEKESDYWLATTNISLLFGEGKTPEKSINDLLICLKESKTVDYLFKKSWTSGNTDYSHLLIDL